MYPEARLAPQQAPWDPSQEIESIWYSSWVQKSNTWVSDPMSPGHLTENAVQGLCRDLLTDAKLRLLDSGYKVIFHVHDEIVTEDKIEFGSLQNFINILQDTNKHIYPDFPVITEAFESNRYKKD